MRIDLSFYGGWDAGRPILVTCGSALSQLWRPVRRDAEGSRAFRGQRGVGGKVAAQRWYQQRSAAPKPRGGSVSPLEEYAVEILDLIAQRPDLTLVETVAELRKRRIKTSRSSLLAFSPRPTQHHAQKKCCKQPNGSEQMWRERAAAGYESKVMLILPGWCIFFFFFFFFFFHPTLPLSTMTAVSTNMVRLERAGPAWRPGVAPFRFWKMGRRSPSCRRSASQ